MDRRRIAVAALIAIFVTPLVAYIGLSLVPGYTSYIVVSNSMEPTIDRGSIIYVQATDDYQPGDVITFVEDDRTITHRIVGTTANGYLTKGDANDLRDEWHVTEQQIIGELIIVIPLYGYVIQIAKTPIGYVMLVFLPSVLLIGTELRDLWHST